MDRKIVAGIIRNKDRSREKFLKSIGKILISSGYAGLKTNQIAEEAGLDRKMINKCFGDLNGLLDEYIDSQDFWSNIKGNKVPVATTDGGHEFSKAMLQQQFDYVGGNPEFQKILLWRLSEERESLKRLTQKQEANGETLLQTITDPYFGTNAEKYRAVMAILIAGTYYLNLYAAVNGSNFCGIDIASEDGRKAIKESLSFLIDKTYEGL
ncbi:MULTISPECIES: TetR/AcrR family transcriptional regulator [unclassified Sphingobacterium]|uniref:TetR/AcrR family transcriptional regulator n=1 Tax=unclassified Sphingobacterium TaxID=2609468 RepID=UPI0025E6BBB7|nr:MULTISPECIES: TetR/AcrR family transcriptional regulator [unclassified Sphingobacterium]